MLITDKNLLYIIIIIIIQQLLDDYCGNGQSISIVLVSTIVMS